MLKFAANLSWLFNEYPLLERFSAARHAGFSGVEVLFPYQYSELDLRKQLVKYPLSMVLINAPAGNWQAGERGLASIPGQDAAFHDSLITAEKYAQALNCRRIHIMAGLRDQRLTVDQQQQLFISRLQMAAQHFSSTNIQLLIEPLNPEDMPGYFLADFSQAQEIISEVAASNVRLQFDIYHCQKIQGNLVAAFERYWPLIEHIQIASSPARNEPDHGEINYPWLFNYLDEKEYSGWIGCEYSPITNTYEGLKWLTTYWQNHQ